MADVKMARRACLRSRTRVHTAGGRKTHVTAITLITLLLMYMVSESEFGSTFGVGRCGQRGDEPQAD